MSWWDKRPSSDCKVLGVYVSDQEYTIHGKSSTWTDILKVETMAAGHYMRVSHIPPSGKGLPELDRDQQCNKCGESINPCGFGKSSNADGPKIGPLMRIPIELTPEDQRVADLNPEERAKRQSLVPNEEFQELCSRCYDERALQQHTRVVNKCEVCETAAPLSR